MLRRSFLFAILALTGYVIGGQLESLQAPRKTLSFAEHARTAQMSPDGKTVAVIGAERADKWFFELWTVDGTRLGKRMGLPVPPGRYHSMSWRQDSREVAVAAGNEVWLVSSEGKRSLGAAPTVRQVQFQEQTLMARCDTSIFCWNARTRKTLWRLDQNYLLQAALDPQGRKLATACFEDGVRVFDLGRKQQILHWGAGQTASILKFRNHGRWITAGFRLRNARQRDRLESYDFAERKHAQTLPTPFLEGIDISQFGETMVVRCRDKADIIENGKTVISKAGEARLVDAVNATGDWVVTAPHGEGRPPCMVWDKSGREEHVLADTAPPHTISFCPDGRLLVVDGKVNLWKL